MKTNKLILLLIVLSFNVNSTSLDGADTTQAISNCYLSEFEIEEQKLNIMISRAYEESSWINKEMKKSQAAWLQYRKSHCDAIYSYYEKGTMRFIAHPACMVDLTKKRQIEIYTNFINHD